MIYFSSPIRLNFLERACTSSYYEILAHIYIKRSWFSICPIWDYIQHVLSCPFFHFTYLKYEIMWRYNLSWTCYDITLKTFNLPPIGYKQMGPMSILGDPWFPICPIVVAFNTFNCFHLCSALQKRKQGNICE